MFLSRNNEKQIMVSADKMAALSSFDFFDRESSSESKVDALLSGNRFDRCGRAVDISPGLGGLYSARTSGKGCMLFKTLYTNACRFDCKYCINTLKVKGNKSSYTPEELSKTFMSLYNNGIVEGLFLSSAIPSDPETVMEKMIETLEIIRYRYRFRGYIHQKILPGSPHDSIMRASKLADRLSINIEAPSKSRLSCLSGAKDYLIDIIRRQRWLKRMEMPGGHTTQFVVGAGEENDCEILDMLDYEYRTLELRRGYFSAFKPCRGTALEKREAAPKLREIRLYNIDFLLMRYGFPMGEVKDVLDDEGNLQRQDPKMLIAKKFFDRAVDVNIASYDELLHVPGIGEIGAKRIIARRKKMRITRRRELAELGVLVKRAEQFLNINGHVQKRIDSF